MPSSALQNPVVWTTGLTALAALATFLYTVWQDHRRLKIRFKPLWWGSLSPVDEAGRCPVVFSGWMTARNRGRTPNRLEDVTAGLARHFGTSSDGWASGTHLP